MAQSKPRRSTADPKRPALVERGLRSCALGLVLLAVSGLGCDGDKKEAAEDSETAADTAQPADSAKAKPTGQASASAAPAAPPGLELFAGVPAFKDKTKPYMFMGVRYDMPVTWTEWNDKADKLISVFKNPPATVKGKLWLVWNQDFATWPTPAAMAKAEGESRNAAVTQGGKAVGKLTVPSACESATFEATNIHHTKQQWEEGAPKAATFGAKQRAGAVMVGKDKGGKWQVYCFRAIVTDEIGLFGAVGYRTDKKGHEANAAALHEMIKSFRSDGDK
ncbi:MAG: hypothetical protein JRI68_31910 [Deltaproteobacteria bacterium]|nr:hypothetical protein [Deltaproteobacteria bacterium]